MQCLWWNLTGLALLCATVSCAPTSRSKVYLLVEMPSKEDATNTSLKFFDVTSERIIENHATIKKPRHWRPMVIRGNRLFGFENGSYGAYDMSGKSVEPLDDVTWLTPFEGKIYGLDYTDHVFELNEDLSLKNLAKFPENTAKMYVLKKTDDEFVFVVQSFNDEVSVISKKQNQEQTSKKIAMGQLLGTNDGHIYVEDKDKPELLDIHEDRVVSRTPMKDKDYTFIYDGVFYHLEFADNSIRVSGLDSKDNVDRILPFPSDAVQHYIPVLD